MIKTGVIGYGYSAKVFHLPFIKDSKELQLTAISSSRIDDINKEYPGVSAYKTAQELIQESGIELAVITAPNNVHFSLAMACLEKGIHIIIEKPVVTSISEAEELLKSANSRDLIVSVFHNRRWDGDFLTVKKIVETDKLGSIRVFESHYDRFRPIVRDRWREQPGSGTGTLYDLGSHLADQVLSLFGMPGSVTARCLNLRENSKTTDYFHVLLHYPSFEVVLHSSTFAAGPNIRFHIQGTKGSFIKYGMDVQEEQLLNGMLPNHPDFGLEEEESFGTFYSGSGSGKITTETGCYCSYYSKIISAIKNGTPVPVSCEEAVNVMRILEIAELSSRMGRTVKFSEFG